MLRLFNSMQFVGTFMALPYVISYLAASTHSYASEAQWTAIVAYVVMSMVMTGCVFNCTSRR